MNLKISEGEEINLGLIPDFFLKGMISEVDEIFMRRHNFISLCKMLRHVGGRGDSSEVRFNIYFTIYNTASLKIERLKMADR